MSVELSDSSIYDTNYFFNFSCSRLPSVKLFRFMGPPYASTCYCCLILLGFLGIYFLVKEVSIMYLEAG